MSFKEFWDKVKKVNRFSLGEVMFPSYIFNKVIFRVGIALVFVWLLLAAWDLNFRWGSNVYVHCPDLPLSQMMPAPPCENPFYNPVMNPPYPKLMPDNPTCLKYGICDREFLLPGESYGSPPGYFYSHAFEFVLLIVISMILGNHFFFNKGYFKSEGMFG